MNNQLVLPFEQRFSTKDWVYIDNCNNVTTWADYFTSGSLTCKRSADAQRKYVVSYSYCNLNSRRVIYGEALSKHPVYR